MGNSRHGEVSASSPCPCEQDSDRDADGDRDQQIHEIRGIGYGVAPDAPEGGAVNRGQISASFARAVQMRVEDPSKPDFFDKELYRDVKGRPSTVL